jgi:hypothetical protein
MVFSSAGVTFLTTRYQWLPLLAARILLIRLWLAHGSQIAFMTTVGAMFRTHTHLMFLRAT